MADSSIVGNASIDLSKIKSKLDGLTDKQITLSINSGEILSSLGDIKDTLKTITTGKHNINLGIDASVLKDLKNIQQQIDAVNKKGASNLPAWNKPKGGFNYLKEYRDELQKQVDSYVKDLSTKGAKNIKTSISAVYDSDGTPNYKGIVQYENEVGKLTQAIMELDKATNVWRVSSTKVTTDYSKQAKETEKLNKFVNDQMIAIEKLNSKAFKQSNPLTGNFEQTAKTSIDAWQKEVEAISKSTDSFTTETENRIKKLAAEAQLVVQEQQKAQYQGQKLVANSFDTDKALASTNLDTQIEKYKQAGIYTDELKTKFDDLKKSLEQVSDQTGLKKWNEDLKQATAEASKLQAELNTESGIAKFETDLKKSENTLAGFAIRYKEAFAAHPEFTNELEAIKSKLSQVDSAAGLKNVNNEIQEFGQRVRNAQAEIDPFVGRAQSLGQVLQQSFGSVGSYLARFVSVFAIINKGVSTIKSMVTEVKSLDTAIMELTKVTDLAGNSLNSFVDNAYKIGKEVGRTGKDVIEATTTFSRAGYDLQESMELSKAALVMTNVGVDIPNMESAASDMISILKAFDKQADESMNVIDKLYNVANKEPLDFGNITQMLVTSGGTLAQGGTSLEQTMGLLTGGFATLRNTSVANG